MNSERAPVIFCDAVRTLGVHNGVARISLVRLSADGQPLPTVEVLLPVNQVLALIRALQQVRG